MKKGKVLQKCEDCGLNLDVTLRQAKTGKINIQKLKIINMFQKHKLGSYSSRSRRKQNMLMVITSQIILVHRLISKNHQQGTSERKEFHQVWTSLICDLTLIFISMKFKRVII